MKKIESKNDIFEWRTGRSCVHKIFLHLVFVTKYRKEVFSSDMLDELHQVFKETCDQMEGELLEFNGENNHVHLLVCAPPKTSVSNLVGKLKGKSSYVLRSKYFEQLKKKLWGDHLWSPSYCAVSCGGAPLEVVKAYIENQARPPSDKALGQFERVTKRHGSLTRP